MVGTLAVFGHSMRTKPERMFYSSDHDIGTFLCVISCQSTAFVFFYLFNMSPIVLLRIFSAIIETYGAGPGGAFAR